MTLKIEKGDEYVTQDGIRRLRICDINGDNVVLENERHIPDRQTGEVKIEMRSRTVPITQMEAVLLAYLKSKK